MKKLFFSAMLFLTSVVIAQDSQFKNFDEVDQLEFNDVFYKNEWSDQII